MVACVAADSFPFPGGAEIKKQASWAEQKSWGEAGRGWVRGGGEPHSYPLTLLFSTLSQFSSPAFVRAFGKGKKNAATQAKNMINFGVYWYQVELKTV